MSSSRFNSLYNIKFDSLLRFDATATDELKPVPQFRSKVFATQYYFLYRIFFSRNIFSVCLSLSRWLFSSLSRSASCERMSAIPFNSTSNMLVAWNNNNTEIKTASCLFSPLACRNCRPLAVHDTSHADVREFVFISRSLCSQTEK